MVSNAPSIHGSRSSATPHGAAPVWDARYGFRDRVTVAPITTRIRRLDAEVLLDQNDGFDQGCVVNLDVIATILRSDLDRRVLQLGEAKMAEVDRAVHLALGMRLPCEVR